MRPLLVLLAGLLATPVASAADHEIAVEMGTLASPDWTSWSMVSGPTFALGFGLRGDYALNDHWAIQAGWHHVRTGRTLRVQDYHHVVGQTAYFGNEAAVGVRYDWPLWDLLVPYAHVDGLLWIADARFDDDPYNAQSAGQVKNMALAGGGRGMLGAEVRIPRKRPDRRGFTGALFLEGGYTWLSTQHFATLGDITLRGFTFRSGLALVY